LSPEQRAALTDAQKHHGREFVLVMEQAMLGGKGIIDALAAAKASGHV
jgi:hypothetical protein